MITHKIGFTRWYDSIPELAQAVRLLERADDTHRNIICDYVIDMQELVAQDTQSEDYGLKKLGAQKVMGLMKSKTKRRWYDQDPTVHRAFNTLYMMDDGLRYEAAIRILVSLQALTQYEHQLNNSISNASEARQSGRGMMRNIVKTIFYQTTPVLLSKIQFVRQDKKEVSQTLPGFQAAPEPVVEEAKGSGHVIDSDDGLKLGGLNMPNSPKRLI